MGKNLRTASLNRNFMVLRIKERGIVRDHIGPLNHFEILVLLDAIYETVRTQRKGIIPLKYNNYNVLTFTRCAKMGRNGEGMRREDRKFKGNWPMIGKAIILQII